MDNNARFITPEQFTPGAISISCKSLNFKQPSLFETCLHAFELLGRLSGSGLPFLFKGGTSMFLHSATPRRISTDIDIMTPVGGDELVVLKGMKIDGPLRFLNPIGGSSPNGLFYWNEAAKLAPEAWVKSE